MIHNNVEILQKSFKHNNCRVQSLSDLLFLNDIKIHPNLLYLHCFSVLFAVSHFLYNHINYTFLAGFEEKMEENFFNNCSITYSIDNNIKTKKDIENYIKKDIPLYALCDANTILTKKIDSKKIQFGVCSGVTIIGTEFPNNVIISQMDERRKNEFSKFNLNLFHQAQVLSIYPSSPYNRCYYLTPHKNNPIELTRQLNDTEYILKHLQNVFRSILDNTTPTVTANTGAECFFNIDGFHYIKEELETMGQMDALIGVDKELMNKIFTLKILLIRKSMISGSVSFNRNELADALQELYQLTGNKKLQDASVTFRNCGEQYRNISRELYFVNKNLSSKKEFINGIIHKFEKVFQEELLAIEQCIT